MPDFPLAKAKIQNSQNLFFKWACKQHLGPVMGQIPRRILKEGRIMSHQYTTEMSYTSNLKKMSGSFDISKEEIKKNPFVVYEKLFETAKEFAIQQIKSTFETITEITDMTGNVVDSRSGFTHEGYLKSLEIMELEFDENDQPNIPTIYGSPELMKQVQQVLTAAASNPAEQHRMNQIIEIKRKQWHDRKNNRKLVD